MRGWRNLSSHPICDNIGLSNEFKESPVEPTEQQTSKNQSDESQPQPNTCKASELLEDLQHPDLADAAKQEQYRLEYLRQLRLRACPGCGDDGIV